MIDIFKYIFPFLIILLCNTCSIGQTEVTKPTFAEYPGGELQLYKYVNDSIVTKINTRLLGDTILHKVFCKFLVSDTGEILNPQIVKTSNSKYVDNLIVAQLIQMPRWTPAKESGKNVPQEFTLPIIIELE